MALERKITSQDVFEPVKCTSLFSWDFVKIDREMMEKYVPSFVMPNNRDNVQKYD